MRIGNPPPLNLTTIQVGGITSPTLTSPLTTTQLTGISSTVIAALPNQREIILTNTNATNGFWVQSTAITTQQLGTFVGGGQIASLTTSSDIRLANFTAATIIVGVNQTSGP